MEEGEERRGTLVDDMVALMSSGHAADVTIMVDGFWLPAHRAVLTARSTVFAAIFREQVLEVTGGSITAIDMSHEVLGQLLQFMYSDEAPLLECVAAELLAVADKYCVSLLKQQCEQQMIFGLTVDNAADSAVLAFEHMCPKLKAAAINFISSHYKEVMATEGWTNALRHHTEVSVEICRLLGDAKTLEAECETEEPAEGEDAKGRLAGDLLALLASGVCSDVTLMVGGVALAAHRAVLAARSPVLAEKLTDLPGGILHVAGAPEQEVRRALRYMYSDQLPPPASITVDLLALADDYGLRVLKEYCEKHLADEITVDNAVSVAIVAMKHSFTSLKDASLDFIGDNIFEVMDTAGWATAIHSEPEALVEISKIVSAAQRLQLESCGEDSSED
ncbi:leucine-zipper-like transcriptional regulator 1 [Schistocerca serialis cubense]|uniref:leucine-zipper-like transcriptional regulator 1 n=1 Tax=Schistocerca serialis cubense TaxID=2023355 RepID=UPI00214E1008|nr:leucine-zipper-like transcriptional regulator 1 [Schistocerca serialis cubense]